MSRDPISMHFNGEPPLSRFRETVPHGVMRGVHIDLMFLRPSQYLMVPKEDETSSRLSFSYIRWICESCGHVDNETLGASNAKIRMYNSYFHRRYCYPTGPRLLVLVLLSLFILFCCHTICVNYDVRSMVNGRRK